MHREQGFQVSVGAAAQPPWLWSDPRARSQVHGSRPGPACSLRSQAAPGWR